MSESRTLDLAFRARAAGLVVATTGSTTLAATATGYTRTTGSFLTDGFLPGMEVIPSGFPETTPGLVAAVSALSLTISGGRSARVAASGRTLTVGLPAALAFGDGATAPETGRALLQCVLSPGAGAMTSYPYRGGTHESTGRYVFRWWGAAGFGADGLRACVDALAARFAPGTPLESSDGSDCKVRGDVTPGLTEITERSAAHLLLVLTVPYRHRRPNLIAA